MLVWFPYSWIKTFWSVWQYHLATTRHWVFFFLHYIVVSWIANWRSTQRRTDNLHEHKMTWLTYVKMIICTLLNVTVTLSNHSSELFSDFHTWHSWNIYIIQNVQHVQHFNNTLGILCDTMNEAAAVSLHFIYATCSTGLVYLWKTWTALTRVERPSA